MSTGSLSALKRSKKVSMPWSMLSLFFPRGSMNLKGESDVPSSGMALPLNSIADAFPPNPAGPTILEGNPSRLFQPEQIRYLQRLARDLKPLIFSLSRSRHHRVSADTLLDSDVFSALWAVVRNPHSGISRLHCPLCAAIGRFRIEYGLLPAYSLDRLKFMLEPQPIPRPALAWRRNLPGRPICDFFGHIPWRENPVSRSR